MSIEAMKRTLEKIATVNAMDYEYQRWAREALAIAEAEKQEPVAYVNGDALDNMLDDRLAFIQRTKSGYRAKPLYTHPQPKREWVGLTDEEIDGLVKNTRWHELIKATEAKLKEKNT